MQSHTHTLVISDVHIGSAISSSYDVLKLLKSLTFKRLILLGDIFDGPHVTKLTLADESLLAYIQVLMEKKIEIVWVRGNHDRIENKILQRFKDIEFVDQYCWFEGVEKYCAMHGHQFDSRSPKRPKLGVMSTYFHSLFASTIRHKATVRTLEKLYTNLRRLSDKIAHGALAYADENGIDYIICAHTHRSIRKSITTSKGKNITYFNTGSWIHIPYSYVMIDEKGAEVKIFEKEYFRK